jgi:Domain of unknown function DUF11
LTSLACLAIICLNIRYMSDNNNSNNRDQNNSIINDTNSAMGVGNPSSNQNNLYDENAYSKLRQKSRIEPINENYDIKFEGVIKDLSNTNLTDKNENVDPWSNDTSETVTVNDVTEAQVEVFSQKPLETIKSANLGDTKSGNVISFEQKFGFWEKSLGKLLKKFWWVGLSVLVLLIAGVFFLVTSNQKENKPAPTLDKISISISGEESVARGSIQKWNLKIVNAENINIENIVVNMSYDQDFKFSRSSGLLKEGTNGKSFTLEGLKSNAEVIQNIEGKYDSNIDVPVNMSAKMTFEVEGFKGKKNSIQEKSSATFVTKVRKSLMRIDISNNGSNNITQESEQSFTVTFANQSGERLEKIGLKMEYPKENQKVIYKNSVLKIPGVRDRTEPTSGSDYWEIDTLEKDQSGTLTVDYSVRGTIGEKITFTASLLDKKDNQPINNASKELFVLSKQVVINSSIGQANGFLLEETSYDYSITVENTSGLELKNLQVTARLEDPTEIFDWSTAILGDQKGELRISDKTVTFTGRQLDVFKSFTPKSKQKIAFRILTKKKPYLSLRNDLAKNFYAKTIVTIEADGIEKITEKGDITRARSEPSVTQSVEYTKINGKSAARITWSVKNSFAEVKDFRMTAKTLLQKGAFQTDKVLPADSKLKFDETTGLYQVYLLIKGIRVTLYKHLLYCLVQLIVKLIS